MENVEFFEFCDVKGTFSWCHGVCVFGAHDFHHFFPFSATSLLHLPLSLLFSSPLRGLSSVVSVVVVSSWSCAVVVFFPLFCAVTASASAAAAAALLLLVAVAARAAAVCCWWVLRVLGRLFLVSVRFPFIHAVRPKCNIFMQFICNVHVIWASSEPENGPKYARLILKRFFNFLEGNGPQILTLVLVKPGLLWKCWHVKSMFTQRHIMPVPLFLAEKHIFQVSAPEKHWRQIDRQKQRV